MSAGRKEGASRYLTHAFPLTSGLYRMRALNPQGCIDFYLPAEGLNQYVESLSSHGSYVRSAVFLFFFSILHD